MLISEKSRLTPKPFDANLNALSSISAFKGLLGWSQHWESPRRAQTEDQCHRLRVCSILVKALSLFPENTPFLATPHAVMKSNHPCRQRSFVMIPSIFHRSPLLPVCPYFYIYNVNLWPSVIFEQEIWGSLLPNPSLLLLPCILCIRAAMLWPVVPGIPLGRDNKLYTKWICIRIKIHLTQKVGQPKFIAYTKIFFLQGTFILVFIQPTSPNKKHWTR